jgi:hypothetical protein
MEPVISEELATFLESGLSIIVATRDDGLQPDGALAWAARVHENRTHLTLFLHEKSASAMLRNLERHPWIAIDFDLPTSHRACQVKGQLVSSRKARTNERSFVEQQANAFADDLDALGIPRALTAGWPTWPCTAFEINVTELYEQTPGPGTGERLK